MVKVKRIRETINKLRRRRTSFRNHFAMVQEGLHHKRPYSDTINSHQKKLKGECRIMQNIKELNISEMQQINGGTKGGLRATQMLECGIYKQCRGPWSQLGEIVWKGKKVGTIA